MKQVTPSVWSAMNLCDFAERGNLPAPGAVLEQTQSFLDFYDFYRGEKALCRAKSQPPD